MVKEFSESCKKMEELEVEHKNGSVCVENEENGKGAIEASAVDVKSKNGDICEENKHTTSSQTVSPEPYEMKIVWQNIVKFFFLHLFALYGLTFFPVLSWQTWIFFLMSVVCSGFGITAGAHRLWAHKTYKAALPLRLFLTFCNSMAGQNSIYVWCRDHRVHHKCSETVGDPHNAKNGFFFAHMGWLLVRKHPGVMRAGKTIDMSDLERDPVVMFQHRFYVPIYLTANIVIPTVLPHYFWNESLVTAYFMAIVRYVIVLHGTWLVNSLAHLIGQKPYDKNIGPVENMIVSTFALGEGFHNYHHTFPYDYGTSEWGFKINLTTAFIDLMAALGQVWDRRKATQETISARALRTGDIKLTREVQNHIKKVL